ncbi:MAG: hypothetical protein CFE36_01770 [Sphingomonadaceae bacterium PASS1]|nr:MAG: hypothetical protein CFE36_01770 [Sphingomonadaceae bacterium PASS1]
MKIKQSGLLYSDPDFLFLFRIQIGSIIKIINRLSRFTNHYSFLMKLYSYSDAAASCVAARFTRDL